MTPIEQALIARLKSYIPGPGGHKSQFAADIQAAITALQSMQGEAVFKVVHGPLGDDGNPERAMIQATTDASLENLPEGTLLYAHPKSTVVDTVPTEDYIDAAKCIEHVYDASQRCGCQSFEIAREWRNRTHGGQIAIRSQPKISVAHHKVIKLGLYGKALDAPTDRRAYTYAEQPNNQGAYRLGSSLAEAVKLPAGDRLDMGLCLLKTLEANGFGVFETDHAPLYTQPQSPAVPEARNIQSAELQGDQSVIVKFPSCRSANAFRLAMLSASQQGDSNGK